MGGRERGECIDGKGREGGAIDGWEGEGRAGGMSLKGEGGKEGQRGDRWMGGGRNGRGRNEREAYSFRGIYKEDDSVAQPESGSSLVGEVHMTWTNTSTTTMFQVGVVI